MCKFLLSTFGIFLFFSNSIFAQSDVLFSVGDTKVKKSDFDYIYKKNNFSNKADFSKASLQNYLDLYVNFRLKVKEAIAQGLDTNKRFKEELKVYERQLLDSYVEKEIIDKLIQQEYERSKTDVNISHIFFTINNDNNEAKALAKANEVYAKIKSGANYETEASLESDDKQTAKKGGKVGWVNAFQLPYPQLEEAIYSMKTGEVSTPIKTRSGFHILKLNSTRAAMPKIKVAIIKKFFPLGDTSATAIKSTESIIREAYAKLKNKTPFAEVVHAYSDDEVSKTNKGELEWFGINTYAKIFEDNAYALKDGEFSVPFKTNTAWYIVKRLQTEKPLPYEDAIPVLKTKLLNTPQYQYEKEKFVQKIIKAHSIKVLKENYPELKQRLINLTEAGKLVYRDTANAKVLLTIGTTAYTENDFGKKAQETYYTVIPPQGSDKYDALINNATQNFIIDFYKDNIKNNNQEYKALMDEYRNGIMIFTLSESNIWNKASEDSTGLMTYYNNHKADFNLDKRATVRTISNATEKQAKAVHKFLQQNPTISDDSILLEMKKNGLSAADWNTQMVEASKTKLDISKESLNSTKLTNNKYEITQIYNLQPAKERTFEECRGYVVAAYQEYIEKQWLQQLRQKYPVEINEAVFNTMIQK